MVTINGRIKFIRKDSGLNQKQFASKLGVTQSGISYMEQEGSTVADSTIKLICSDFGVNEEWLRYGEGAMHTEPSMFSLGALIRQRGASDVELEILKAYFDLDPGIRKAAMEHFKSRLATAATSEDEVKDAYTQEEFKHRYPEASPTLRELEEFKRNSQLADKRPMRAKGGGTA